MGLIEVRVSTVDSEIVTESVPGRVGHWVSLVAALVGGALSVELTKLHFALERDPTYQSYCNVNQTVNCDAVAKSSYAVLLGIPLSVWGIFAYTAALVLAIWGIRTRRQAPAALILLLGIAMSLGALLLAYLSAFVIGSWCVLCAFTWGVDATLLINGFVMVRKNTWRSSYGDVLRYLHANPITVAVLGVCALLSLGVTARMLPHKEVAAAAPAVLSAAARSAGKAPVMGVNAAGHPTVGAVNPKVVIEEFSDYQCPYCAKSHANLRALVNRYPDAIQVVHRHFPLDNDCNPAITRPFHSHACYYAKLAVCAGTFNRFWEANDYLFTHGRDEVPVAAETLARAIGVKGDELRQCLSSRATELLKPDLDEGVRLKIDGTPTFVINGEKATGELPDAIRQQYPL